MTRWEVLCVLGLLVCAGAAAAIVAELLRINGCT